MSLHALVTVVGAQLEELRQVTMPYVEVDGYGAGAHAELVYRHGRVVDDADPANHASRSPFEPSDGAPCRTHLAEVHAHAATILRYLREVVYTAVDALERVGNGVYEAARELVAGRACVG